MKPQLSADELGITEKQKENLNKILAFARTHPDIPFSMRYFLQGSENGKMERYVEGSLDVVPQTHPCGTACCLAGMGLQAEITPLSGETWGEYINRAYGIEAGSDEFDFLFSAFHENSLPAAIRRLEYFLTQGIPQDVDLETYEIPA